MPKKYNEAPVIEEWKRLYESGCSSPEIAKKFGVSFMTVKKYLREYGVKIRTDAENKLGELNPMWKGGEATNKAGLHRYVAYRMPRPKVCPKCRTRPAIDLANVSPKFNKKTYTRELKNWKWLCRRCHMYEDGRIKNLKQYG